MSRLYVNKRVEIYKRKSNGDFATNPIVLTDAFDIEVKEGIGKSKDTFSFRHYNPRNSLIESFHSGTATTQTLKFGPIDSDFTTGSNQKVFVYINGVLQDYTTDYTISSSTLTFVSAPSSGTEHIRVAFKVVEQGDLCRIYQWKTTSVLSQANLPYTANDILIEGVVARDEIEVNPGSTSITKVYGNGIIENLFSGLVFIRSTTTTTQKPHLIIQDTITQLNNYNPLRTIFGANVTDWATLQNATVTTSGAAFTNIQYYTSYRSALEIIEDISSDQYTKDGAYYFYIKYNSTDDRYEFYWKPKTTTMLSTTITEGIDTVDFKVHRDQDEVINMVIYNIGLDCNEVPWEFPNFASQTTSQGTKWKYVIATNHILSDLIQREFEAKPGSFNTGADGNRLSNYPQSTAVTNSWVFQFYKRNADGSQTANLATANTNIKYNDAIVDEGKWRGKAATNKILDMYSVPRIKAEVQYVFTHDYTLGSLMPLTSKTYNLSNYALRLTEIKYDNAFTTLFFEEDEKTAIERVING